MNISCLLGFLETKTHGFLVLLLFEICIQSYGSTILGHSLNYSLVLEKYTWLFSILQESKQRIIQIQIQSGSKLGMSIKRRIVSKDLYGQKRWSWKGLPYCYYEYCGIGSDKIICTVVVSVSIDFPSIHDGMLPFIA